MQIAVVVVEEKGRRILLGFVLEPVEENFVPVINQLVAPGIGLETEIFEIGNLGEEKDIGRPVAHSPQRIGQRLDAGCETAAAYVDGMGRLVERGQDRYQSRRGPSRGTEGLLEKRPLAGQRVQMGAGIERIAVIADMVGAKGIDGNQQNIGTE